MSQYVLIIIWLGLCFIFTEIFKPYTEDTVYGVKIKKYNIIAAIIIMVPLIYWAGTRTLWRFDTGNYANTFRALPTTFSGAIHSWGDFRKDQAFYVFSGMIHAAVGDNTTAYFMIIAAIQGIILGITFRKYSVDYLFSVFVFVAATDYLSWMHNGMRQFLAVTITMLALPFILERKYIWAILIALFASLFHASALLMIPVILIVPGKAWNFRTVAMLLGVVIVYLALDRFTGWIDFLLEDTQYANVVEDWISWEDNGTNPIRVLVYSIPMILSLVGLRFVRAEQSPLINIAVNCSIVTTALYIVSMFTSGIFVGRLPIYTSIYANGILLPWEIDNIFDKGSARVVKIIAVIAYLAFYYYQCHLTWGIF